MVLESVIEMNRRIAELKSEIDKLREESGIKVLEDEMKALTKDKKVYIEKCIEEGRTEEGSLRVVNVGRRNRVIRVSEFKEVYPDVFNIVAVVPITTTTEIMVQRMVDDGYSKKEAMEIVKEELEGLCDVEMTSSWDVVDVLEG